MIELPHRDPGCQGWWSVVLIGGRMLYICSDCRALHRQAQPPLVPGERFYEDGDGHVYRVSIAPMERRGALGVDPRLKAIVFEDVVHGWVGSCPAYRSVLLEALTERDLAELLEQALARG